MPAITEDIKGSKRLEARKLVKRLLLALVSEMTSLSQNRAMRTGGKKDTCESFVWGRKGCRRAAEPRLWSVMV